MSWMKKIFGKQPKPQPEPVPEPQPMPVPVVPLTGSYGVASPTMDAATIEQGEQLHQLALMLAQQHAALDYHAAGVEAVIEQAQRLYGRQVQHQARLQDYQRQRFPVDLMAAGLFNPVQAPQPTAEPKQRDTSLRKKARKVLGD